MPEIKIPEPEKSIDGVYGIPEKAGEIENEKDNDPESIPYKISFASYNSKECEIDSLKDFNAKAALGIIRDVGVYFSSEENYSAKSGDAVILPVFRDGEYNRRLYCGLDPQAEIKEIKFTHTKKRKKESQEIDIRVFFYSLVKERIFYLIAVRQSHYNTDKGSYHK